jgi:hypothetical protein
MLAMDRWPNFFIIGAPKCGTTSLATWLADHQQIYMSPRKEARYFDRDLRTRFRLTERQYLALFRGATEQHIALGEATAWYLYSREAVPNIEREVPGSRYIVMIRNPVDMAYSLHEQMRLHGAEPEPDFEKAWDLGARRRMGKRAGWSLSEPRLLDYESVCRLGEQLERLYAAAPKHRILVIMLQDVGQGPRREYLRVLGFLGVADDGRTEFAARNPAKAVRSQSLHYAFALLKKGERVVRQKLGLASTNSRILSLLKGANLKPRPRPAMAPDLRARLEASFAPDIARLERVLERDLSEWITSRQTAVGI